MKILLIESDSTFAHELSKTIEARGVEARVTGDGKEGVDLARVDRPDLIVLCVELPRMSGYSVCNKLKKDDQLKSIPLVIISAEATPETFDQHRKLKTRAEGYLIKPFEPAALLATIEGLIALPPEAAMVSSDELISLDEVELDTSVAEPAQRSEGSTPQVVPAEDDDLKLLDEAFESLASEEAQQADATEEATAREQAPNVADLSESDDARVHAEIDKLGADADAALAALSSDETTDVDLGRAAAVLDAAPGSTSVPAGDGSSAALAAAGHDARAQDAELERLQGRNAELLAEVARANEALERRSGEAAAVSARLRALEADLDERRTAASRVDEQLRKAAEEHTRTADAAAGRAEAALRAAAEETRRADERARALEAEAKNHGQRAEREELARKAADAAAAASVDRARVAEERTRAAEERARAAESNLHVAEERVHAAEQLTHTAEARAGTAEARTIAAEARADTADQESASLKLRLDEAEQAYSLKTAEAEQARERAEGLARELDTTQARVAAGESDLGALRAELERVRADLESVNADLQSTRAELAGARTAAEGARADSERKITEGKRRIGDLEAQNAKHEERVVKAYQKIKADEKIREKTRKALAIALQLLEERVVGAPPAEVQPRRE